MKLNLGAGHRIKQGYVNVDLEARPGIDQTADLNKLPWPWQDGEVDEIFTEDCLEHLAPVGPAAGQLNIIAVMNEIRRILKPGGLVEIIVPSTDGPGAFQDPTHMTFWNKNTFIYFLEKGPYSVPGSHWPWFTINARDLGIADSDVDDFGVVWACARLRKPDPDKVEEEDIEAPTGEGAVEGADAKV